MSMHSFSAVVLTVMAVGFFPEVRGTGMTKCPAEPCPTPLLLSPTCGSDGQIYNHECEIEQKNCRDGSKITVAPSRRCRAYCRGLMCHTHFLGKQKCREDGRWGERTTCMFIKEECKKEVPLKEVDESFCPKKSADSWK